MEVNTTQSRYSKGIRSLVFLVAALVFVTLLIFLVDYLRHLGQTRIDILALPADSTITIDGIGSKGGKVYLKPGRHTFVASRQYFDNDVLKLDTKDLVGTSRIYLLPKANSSQATQWLEDHPDVQAKREAAGGEMSALNQKIINNRYPILIQLPYENDHFRVDYRMSDESKPEFTVTLFGIINRPSQYDTYLAQLKQYKQEALKYLRDNKVSPGDYKVTYSPNDPGG